MTASRPGNDARSSHSESGSACLKLDLSYSLALSFQLSAISYFSAPAPARPPSSDADGRRLRADSLSPRTLRHARDVAVERQLAEAEAAQGELAHVGARTAAPVAAIPQPDLELRRLVFLRDFCSRGH